MSGLIPQRFIETLLERVDLVELVGTRVALKKAGNSYKACCPFHDERSPSFHVRADKGFYHCFGCGAHGDAISFVREFDHLSFTEAVEELAKRAGLEVPYDAQARQEQQQTRSLTDALDFATRFYQRALAEHPQSALARDYLQRRGLTTEMVERYALGFAPPQGDALANAADPATRKALADTGTIQTRYERPRDLLRNRITFPIRNTRGRTIGFGGRTLGDDKAKYINSPESDVFHKSHEVYGLYEVQQAQRQIDRLLVVEGYMDVIALAQFGITCAVATLGTATNTDNITALLRHARHLIFCFDGDAAGYRAADKAMENALELLNDGIHLQFLILPQGEDPDTLIRREGAEAFRRRMDGATPLSRFLFERLGEGLDLQLPEHRGELRARALPLLKRMPPSTLREAMWDILQRLCTPQRQERQERQNRNGPRSPGTPPLPPARAPDIRLDRNVMLCLGLVQNPTLAARVLELAQHGRRLHQAAQFSDWLLRENLQHTTAVLARLATDDDAYQRFGGLFDGMEHMPTPDAIEAEIDAILTPDDEARRKTHLRALLNQAQKISDLSDAQRQALQALSRNVRTDTEP